MAEFRFGFEVGGARAGTGMDSHSVFDTVQNRYKLSLQPRSQAWTTKDGRRGSELSQLYPTTAQSPYLRGNLSCRPPRLVGEKEG